MLEVSTEILAGFNEYALEILESPNFQSQKAYIQHGTTTLYDHVYNVALRSYVYALNKKDYDLKAVVRGALLHDYFLYDWHVYDHKNGHERLHGFKHPAIAVRNALNLNFYTNILTV